MRRRRANAHNKLWWMKNTVPIHRPFLNELITDSKRRNSNYGFTYASFLLETVMFFSKFQTYLFFFCAKVVIKTLSNDWVFSSCSNKKVDSLAGTINASGFERDNSDEHAVLIFYRNGAREWNEVGRRRATRGATATVTSINRIIPASADQNLRGAYCNFPSC